MRRGRAGGTKKGSIVGVLGMAAASMGLCLQRARRCVLCSQDRNGFVS